MLDQRKDIHDEIDTVELSTAPNLMISAPVVLQSGQIARNQRETSYNPSAQHVQVQSEGVLKIAREVPFQRTRLTLEPCHELDHILHFF